tara:strand:- start:2267 stop:2512 length:246 start_codon:yes stop_codon:yes gene_type:complete
MRKDFIWVGRMPGVCGYGISVIGKTKADARRSLEKSYNKWRNDYGFHFMKDINTYNKAMDYFGGWIEKKYFDFGYYDDFAE